MLFSTNFLTIADSELCFDLSSLFLSVYTNVFLISASALNQHGFNVSKLISVSSLRDGHLLKAINTFTIRFLLVIGNFISTPKNHQPSPAYVIVSRKSGKQSSVPSVIFAYQYFYVCYRVFIRCRQLMGQIKPNLKVKGMNRKARKR